MTSQPQPSDPVNTYMLTCGFTRQDTVNGYWYHPDHGHIAPSLANYLCLSVLEGRRDELMSVPYTNIESIDSDIHERLVDLDRQIAAVKGG